MKNKKSILISVILTLCICILAFLLFYKYYLSNIVTEKVSKEVTVIDTGIADAVEKVYDSVVTVESYINGKLYSTGTGFVFDSNGYILTNYHVIKNSTEIKVILTNENNIEAKVIGQDSYSDIAVLSIPKNYVIQIASIGSSEDLRVGDTAFAVGAPIDASTYSWTVTRGIISGKNREVEVLDENKQAHLMEVLQTDAAINEGNSGGPLCNSNGEVIGITNMKLASSNIEGMGFAIPIEIAKEYANKFIEGEKVERPYLGISIYEKNENNENTIFVVSVDETSEAYKSGLRQGDIIKKINDVEIKDNTHFKYQLYKYNIGEKIRLLIKRSNKEKTIEILLKSKS